MDINDVNNTVNELNKSTVGATITAGWKSPEVLIFSGTSAVPGAQFYYYPDSLGIFVASGASAGGTLFSMPVGFNTTVLNEYLKCMCIVSTCLNITNTDASQISNPIKVFTLSPDGSQSVDNYFVNGAISAQNFQPNLLNPNTALVLTAESAIKYSVTVGAAPNITTITLKDCVSVPLSMVDDYLRARNLTRSGMCN